MTTLIARHLENIPSIGRNESPTHSDQLRISEDAGVTTSGLGDLSSQNAGSYWIEAMRPWRGDELPIPPRSMPREIDLS